MTLSAFLQLARRRYLFPILGAIIVIGLLIAAGQIRETSYTASTKLFITARGVSNIADLVQGGNFTQSRVKTYVDLASTSLVARGAEKLLNLSAGELAGRITADAALDQVIISVAATSSDPGEAARIANAAGVSLTRAVESLETPGSIGAKALVTLTVVEQATPPPFRPAGFRAQTLLLGAVLGAFLGVAGAFAYDHMPSRERRRESLDQGK